LKLRLVQFLSCPCCNHQPLNLESFNVEAIPLSESHLEKCRRMCIDPASLRQSVIDGLLTCDACQTWFPIHKRIPVMHKFRHAFHDEFVRKFGTRSATMSRFHPPQGEGKPGEPKTLRNYTETWEGVGDDGMVFTYTIEQEKNWFAAMLDWPDWVMTRMGLRVLDVGVGFGHETRTLQALIDGEIFGVDLNLSILASSDIFAAEPFIHFICCSLFDIPLPKQDFDVVIAPGVLHHTYSTKAAFNAVLGHMRHTGMIFIWLYWTEDQGGGGPWRQLFHNMRELAFRPIVARLPLWLQQIVLLPFAIMYYPMERKRVPNPDKWKLSNTVKNLRDRYTCIYAHRHRLFEMFDWMTEQDMACRFVDMYRFKELNGYWNFGLSVRGQKRDLVPKAEGGTLE